MKWRRRSPRHLRSEAPAWQGRSERRVLGTRASDAGRRCAPARRWRGPESNRRYQDFKAAPLRCRVPPFCRTFGGWVARPTRGSGRLRARLGLHARYGVPVQPLAGGTPSTSNTGVPARRGMDHPGSVPTASTRPRWPPATSSTSSGETALRTRRPGRQLLRSRPRAHRHPGQCPDLHHHLRPRRQRRPRGARAFAAHTQPSYSPTPAWLEIRRPRALAGSTHAQVEAASADRLSPQARWEVSRRSGQLR
jgi:hypothetical protein